MPHRAFIVSVARTAAGKRNGRISHLHPATLGARVVDHLVAKHPDLDPAEVDDVIFGCVSQVGMQAANLGRNVVLASGVLPLSVPGTTVDRQCGSSQQAIHFAAQAVMSGTQDIVIAGGAESMSQVPLMANMPKGLGVPNSPTCQVVHGEGGFYSCSRRDSNPQSARVGVKLASMLTVTTNVCRQFVGAERVCSQYEVTRVAMDEFAAASHAKAVAAQQAGHATRLT
jgi:acetyl-CoA C-acetyltransferase